MNLKRKTPSSKVFYVLIITTFVIVFIISYSSYKKNPSPSNIKRGDDSAIVVIENQLKNNYTDIDGSGILEWKKTLDSLESNNKRYEDFDFGIETDPNSFTSEVGISAMLKILESMANPNAPLNEDAILGEVARATEENLRHNDKFSSQSMFEVETNPESIKKYINSLVKITNEQFIESFENPPALEEDFINIMSDLYINLSTKLSSVEVPTNFLSLHAEYINGLDAIAFYSDIMINEMNDPLLAYAAIPKFNEKVDLTERLFTQIINYPKNNGIIFEEGDIAYEFYNE